MSTHMATYNNMRAQGRSIDEIRNSIIHAVRASPEWMDRQKIPGAEQAIRFAPHPPPNTMNPPSFIWPP